MLRQRKHSKMQLLAIASLAIATANADPAAVAEKLEKRDNWAQGTLSNCFGNDPNGNAQIHIDTWGYWADDWGSGLLDNLRGQCGGIYDWQFWYDNGDNSLGGHAQFYAYDGDVCAANAGCPGGTGICSGHCVENAIWLASQSSGAIWGVTCGVN
jgi:hypothetical protein